MYSTVSKAPSPLLLLQRMQHQLLIPLHSILQRPNRHILPRPMCNQNCSRPVQIPRVVTLQIRNIRTIVNRDRLKS